MAKEKADKANAEADMAKATESDDEDDSQATGSAAATSDESDDDESDDDESDDDESDDDESDDDESDAEHDEVTKADGPEAKKSSTSHPPLASRDEHADHARSDQDHGDHGDHGHDDHGLAHTMPVKGLIGVWAALMVFTVLTVSVTAFDLGYRMNLVVAMVIATIKAGLVMMFFMHLWWDKRFNTLVFLGSFLFVALFVGLIINDRGEYQVDINAYEDAKAQQ